MDKREDAELRLKAFEVLDDILDGGAIFPTRAQLRNLDLPVSTPHLVDRQKGIWNPSWLLATLSVVTVLDGPYPDKELSDGLWEYQYRAGTTEGDNRRLQRAVDLEVDIAYFREVKTGHYQAFYPVRVIQNDPIDRKVLLAAKEFGRISWTNRNESVSESLRSWAVREVKVRLHQERFRRDVLAAYEMRCAVCELPIDSLLDAAHIDPDSSVEGEPVVQNGLALCKLHHYAFDSNVVGFSAAGKIHVAERVLAMNGPRMIEDGLKAFHLQRLNLPRTEHLRPGVPRLKRRWEEFRTKA